MGNSHIKAHKAEIHALCRAYGVERLELFGSAIAEAFDAATSDLDFIVQFADTSPGCADRYLDFAEALEQRFGREVDLVTERSISNPYFRPSINRHARPWLTDIVKKRLACDAQPHEYGLHRDIHRQLSYRASKPRYHHPRSPGINSRVGGSGGINLTSTRLTS